MHEHHLLVLGLDLNGGPACADTREMERERVQIQIKQIHREIVGSMIDAIRNSFCPYYVHSP